ncbi:hypothetical protein SAMN05216326_12211 [Nitrosomonas marina]|uniref:Uncharacterized protein n=1 Tax=Nitrosomonas marina TaxID=917 RepID=A0A1I0DTB0_9PROT|nr:hypothetical protein [Nitrosomonas marina]SET35046.1 hypothetical protein SAMN05216326_12211 [Nitrosomonas marina]
MKKIDKVLLWVTPLIAILVVVNQFYRVHSFDLSTWQGGGFGMFSSVDTIDSRFFKVYLHVGHETIPVQLKDEFNVPATIARAEPTAENLENLARQIYQANWIHSGTFTSDPHKQDNYRPVLVYIHKAHIENTEQLINIEGVVLELWKTRFDSKTSTIKTYKYTEYAYPNNPS